MISQYRLITFLCLIFSGVSITNFAQADCDGNAQCTSTNSTASGTKTTPVKRKLLTDTLFTNPVYVTAGLTRNDNVNRASDNSDKLSDNTYNINFSNGTSFSTSLHTRILMSGSIGWEKQQQYDALDRISAGLNGELQYRASGAFDSATFGLFARASIDRYKSNLRSGNRISTGVNVRKPLNDSTDISGTISNNLRAAENNVFNNKDKSFSLSLEYLPIKNRTIYLSGEYRVGDTVSTSIATSQSAALADVISQDDAYGSITRFAYRFEAISRILTLGYNMSLGPRDSVDIFWTHVVSASSKTPVYAGASGSGPYAGAAQTGPGGNAIYISNQIGIAYLMSF